MNWGSINEFFAMGGRGLYVWGSYAVFAICIAIETYAVSQRQSKLLRELAENLDPPQKS